MRDFNYFLYENDDPDRIACNALNPRKFMNAETSCVLSAILNGSDAESVFRVFGREEIDRLVRAGFLRLEAGAVSIAFPFFVEEDAEVLRAYCRHYAAKIADGLAEALSACRRIVQRVENGYAEEINLYHVLCGMVFDGVLSQLRGDPDRTDTGGPGRRNPLPDRAVRPDVPQRSEAVERKTRK